MKKRLIFTLLYEDGYFVLSRNFRTQQIGDVYWLERNYDFSRVAFFIDELIVLNVSRDFQDQQGFRNALEHVAKGCFAPISAGGGIRTIEDAEHLFSSGADKIVLNSALYENPELVREITTRWGRQATVGSLDARKSQESYAFFSHGGRVGQPSSAVRKVFKERLVGEIYLNSIDRDGTGQGLDLDLVNFLQSLNSPNTPLIVAGGAGRPEHLLFALNHPGVNAVATANLLNFVGDGLRRARKLVAESGIPMASWELPTTLD